MLRMFRQTGMYTPDTTPSLFLLLDGSGSIMAALVHHPRHWHETVTPKESGSASRRGATRTLFSDLHQRPQRSIRFLHH